jgi:type I restriction enzyme S subunit
VKIKNGDLLLAWSGTPGTSFGAHIWNRGDGVLNQHIFRVDIDSNVVNADWLKDAINTELHTMISRAHGAVGLRHITKGEVQKLLIVLPPLKEQHRLSEELRRRTKKADAICSTLQKQLEAINALPAAIMREAFGGIE